MPRLDCRLGGVDHAAGVDHAGLACRGRLEAVNADHPVLAGEDLLEVFEADVLLPDDDVAHAVKAPPAKRLLRSRRIPAAPGQTVSLSSGRGFDPLLERHLH